MNSRSARTTAAALVTVAALGLTACGADAGAAVDASSTPGLPELLKKAEESGSLKVGASVNAPIAYLDTSTGQLAGITADVMREYLDRKGLGDKVELDVEMMDFSSLIPALQSGRIDYIIDTMYVTPQRDEVVDFTDTLFYNPEALVVPKGNPGDLAELSQLCGKSAGSYEGSAYLTMITAASDACGSDPIDVKTYPKVDDVMNDIAAGRLDAGVIDATLTSYAISANPGMGIELVTDYAVADKASTAASNAVTPGNEDFLTDYDEQLAAMKSDGTFAEILEANGLTPADYFLQP